MQVLPRIGEDELISIRAVPGLYISGRLPASSPAKLSSKGITHIISVLKDDEFLMKPDARDEWSRFRRKRIEIYDDGTEDILSHLDEVYNWIEDALADKPPTDANNNTIETQGHNVLIHCRQGISRSGAFVVGYLMKKFSLSYTAALDLARRSRPFITPNSGFAKQLRIYEQCNWDIYLPEPSRDLLTGPEPTQDTSIAAGTPRRTPKAAYKVWKKEHDRNTTAGGGGVHLGRFSSMAEMAADFGRRRLEAQAKAKADQHSSHGGAGAGGRGDSEHKPCGTSNSDDSARRSELQWQRVANMEKAWNDKLINGDVERAKQNGKFSDLMQEVFDSVGDRK